MRVQILGCFQVLASWSACRQVVSLNTIKLKTRKVTKIYRNIFFLFPTSLSLIHTIEYTADSVLHNFCWLHSIVLGKCNRKWRFWDLRDFCQIESFLCINTLIKPEDQDRYLQEQKDKFTPYISELQMDADIKQVRKGQSIHLFPLESCSLLNSNILGTSGKRK